jgi:hypothetical protein
MTSNGDWIAQHNLLRVDYAMLSLTSIVFLARIGVQIWRRKNVETQDICLYIAFLAYLAFTILYIVITPIFFKIQALQAEKLAPWPTMMEDIKFASKVMWSSGMEYWTCLWFVKFSLLALYKKLLVGMPRGYVKIWWATLVFCIVVSKWLQLTQETEKRLIWCRRGLLVLSRAQGWRATIRRSSLTRESCVHLLLRREDRRQIFTMRMLWIRCRI